MRETLLSDDEPTLYPVPKLVNYFLCISAAEP